MAIANDPLGTCRVVAVALMSVFCATTALAEWYVGAYGGLSYPGALTAASITDPSLNGGVTNARVNDLELHNSPVGGLKVGYFFAQRPWLGIEGDVFTLKPDVKQQDVVGGTSGGPVFRRYAAGGPAAADDHRGEYHHPVTLHE